MDLGVGVGGKELLGFDFRMAWFALLKYTGMRLMELGARNSS